MAKPETMDKLIADAQKPGAIDEMPLESYEDYKAYNAAARKENKRLKVLRYPCIPCPEELHPTERIVFGRNDQPENALPVFLSNHLIHFQKTLYPGKTYDLPRVVINYLADKGVPVWKRTVNADGSADTFISHKTPRFNIRSSFAE